MKKAIEYVLANYNYTLFTEGGNYAQFLTQENDIIEMMFDYVKKEWLVYKEIGKAIAPTIKEIFTFSINN